VETPDSRVEPAFQGSPLPSPGKDEDPESEFAENDGIDSTITTSMSTHAYDSEGRRVEKVTGRVQRWFRRVHKKGAQPGLQASSVLSGPIKKDPIPPIALDPMSASCCGSQIVEQMT
jgi:hypothetical protein